MRKLLYYHPYGRITFTYGLIDGIYYLYCSCSITGCNPPNYIVTYYLACQWLRLPGRGRSKPSLRPGYFLFAVVRLHDGYLQRCWLWWGSMRPALRCRPPGQSRPLTEPLRPPGTTSRPRTSNAVGVVLSTLNYEHWHKQLVVSHARIG